MPTVTGPLLSVSASGSVGRTITFRKTTRGHVARKWSKPTGTATADQLTVRDRTKTIAQAWLTVSPEDRLTWQPLANARNYTAQNTHFVENWKRLARGDDLTAVWPPVTAPTPVAYVFDDGDDLPVPDCTGDYYQIDQVNGHDAYARLDGLYFVAWATLAARYFLMDNPDSLLATIKWRGETQPDAAYQHFQNCAGTAYFEFL